MELQSLSNDFRQMRQIWIIYSDGMETIQEEDSWSTYRIAPSSCFLNIFNSVCQRVSTWIKNSSLESKKKKKSLFLRCLETLPTWGLECGLGSDGGHESLLCTLVLCLPSSGPVLGGKIAFSFRMTSYMWLLIRPEASLAIFPILIIFPIWLINSGNAKFYDYFEQEPGSFL